MPTLVLLAGPDGAGKTTFINGFLRERAEAFRFVNPDEVARGLTGAGVALFLAVPVGERFGVGGFVNYERRLGDVKDSPLVDGADVWRAGVIGVVRFSSPN